MRHARSADGTEIAYDRAGSGLPVILVGGGLTDRTENAPLQPVLAAAGFTVLNYDRRGRGASTDAVAAAAPDPAAPAAPTHPLARELEDLAALIEQLGASAHLFGASSGGALALEAAAAGLPVARVAVYEVPYAVGDDAVAAWLAYVDELHAHLAAGRRDAALAAFMRLAGSSEEEIAGARASAYWPGLLALAHTLAYDAACLGDGAPPAACLAAIEQPVLVATGGAAAEFFTAAADAVAAALSRAERLVLPDQGHVAAPDVLGPALARFFGA